MNESRRNILKMFGIGAAVATSGAAVAEIAAAVPAAPPTPVLHPMNLPLKPPEGMVYQWKRVFLTDDTPDFDNLVEMIRAGWKPVPMRRHAEHFSGGEHSYWIEAGGLVLMEKPAKDIPPPRAYPVPEQDPHYAVD